MTTSQQTRSNLDTGERPGSPPTGPSAPAVGDRGSPSSLPSTARESGAHGGLGPPSDNEPDPNRKALFSGIHQGQTQMQQYQPAGSTYCQPGVAAGPSAGEYSGGFDQGQELTMEEQNDAEYQFILQEKKRLREEGASSVSRSLPIAQQANETGVVALDRVNAQVKHLINTEGSVDLVESQKNTAQDKFAEIKTAKSRTSAIRIGNPFTSKQRLLKADEDGMKHHAEELKQREGPSQKDLSARKLKESNFSYLKNASAPRQQTRKTNYGKYNLEDEEAADEFEDHGPEDISELESQVNMLNMVGKAIGKEVDGQNKRIDGLWRKRDYPDDGTRVNRERLPRIK